MEKNPENEVTETMSERSLENVDDEIKRQKGELNQTGIKKEGVEVSRSAMGGISAGDSYRPLSTLPLRASVMASAEGMHGLPMVVALAE